MRKKEKAKIFYDILEELYPDAKCTLNYDNAFQLLIATQLAAQCTDERVNIVTKDLFKRYKSIKDFADADIDELESLIRSTGFYKNKAKHIISCSKKLLDEYNGIVPDNMEALLTLDGVGRKTANLLLGNIFNKGGMVIDTHAKRLLYRIGLTKETEPKKVEFDTQPLIPLQKQSAFCHRLVYHGRAICTAQNPKCSLCKANNICSMQGVKKHK